MVLSGRDYRNILKIIDAVYSIPDRSAMFKVFCEELQKFIGICSAVFIPADKTGAFQFSGYEIFNNREGAMLEYLAHYAPQDPFISCGWFQNPNHLNEVARNTDLMPQLIRTEFACDFLIPVASVFYIVASTLSSQGDTIGIIGIHRMKNERNFSRRDKRILNYLLPHMARSIHTRELMSGADSQKDDCGVIMTDETGRPIFMNDEARRALRGASIKAIPEPGFSPGPVFFKNRHHTYRVRTVPISGKGEGKFILLEPYPPRSRLDSKLDDFGLTGREKEVAVLVLHGHSNREIAERLFVCEMTVKDHLKSIFGKLKISRRSELAARALIIKINEYK